MYKRQHNSHGFNPWEYAERNNNARRGINCINCPAPKGIYTGGIIYTLSKCYNTTIILYDKNICIKYAYKRRNNMSVNSFGLDFDILTSKVGNKVPELQDTSGVEITTTEQPKRKRGRPRKSEQQNSQEGTIVPRSTTSVSSPDLPLCQTNEPYEDTYDETNNMLKVSVAQLDILTNDVKIEIDNIRNSKTLKGKYKYISDLCATAGSLVSSKISAIKEINAVKTKCHELEMKRIKDIKSMASNQQDDDKYIADLYNAYINTPIGSATNPALKFTSSNVAGNMNVLMAGVPTGNNNEEQNFNNFMNNLTPEQNRMLLGDNPNIETVLVYDPVTGAKDWDVIDTNTGTPVPNYPRPDRSLLDDTSVDTATGIATNTNIGQSWKVVVRGDMISQY
jgi:hypothetical protein